VLFLLPAGLIFATEEGYLKLGLEKYYNAIGLERLWGGLPHDPKKALLQSLLKMQKVQTLHFFGSISAEGNLSTGDIPKLTKISPLFSQQEQVLGSIAESISANMNIEGDYQKPNNLSATVKFELPEGLLSVPLTQNSVPVLDLRVVDNKFYFKIPILSTVYGSEFSKWIKVDSGEYSAQREITKEEVEKKINDFANAIKSSQRSSDKVSGKSVYRYQLVLDMNKFGNQPGKQTSIPLSDIRLGVYIGKRDHLIYRISIDEEIGANASGAQTTYAKVKGQIDFSNFNKSVSIETPDETEVVEEGLMGLLSKISSQTPSPYGETDLSVQMRDLKRKNDLKKIKSLLEDYHKDNGQYPVSIEIDKTNNEEGVLSTALVGKYTSSPLPVDPKNPEYWYGYKSDGTSFTLWSLLENKTDPEGVMDGKWFKYILRND